MKEEKAWSDLTDKEQKKLLKKYQDSTGPEACKKLGVRYTSARTPLHTLAPKNMGHGGARPGSGNKKGIKLCPTCRKKIENCSC